MALFPAYTTVEFSNPVGKRTSFKTSKTSFGELGGVQRKRQRLYPLRDITLKYENISLTDAAALWQFYTARSGSYEEFSFIDIAERIYSSEYVGCGDGTTTVFSLPAKSAALYKVYIDGIEQTETTNYTISAGTGADGEDQLTMVVAPADGQRITFDFTGYLKVRCYFADDDMDEETFYNRLVSTGVTLKGLLNA